MAPTLGYWDIRGLANSIRMLLHYTDTTYTDEYYSVKVNADGSHDFSQWSDKKPNLGVAFPNLPYYFDGDVKLTQSNAILLHIGRKHNMNGMTDDEKDRVNVLLAQSVDWRMALAMVCYGPNFEQSKKDYIAGMDKQLQSFSDYLGDRVWFAGEKPTIADFVVFDGLQWHFEFAPEVVSKCEKLMSFKERFENLPKIKAFLTSDRNPKPLFNKIAHWGNK